MNPMNIRRLVGQINDAAEMLEISLRRAKDFLDSDDCPKPYERWDDAAEKAGFAAGEINCGDFAQQVTEVTDALELLAREIK